MPFATLNHQRPVIRFRCPVAKDYVAFAYEALTKLGYDGYGATALANHKLFRPFLHIGR